MLVFLDLEETVIDDWDSANLLPGRLTKIKKIFEDGVDIVGLMSWAVQDDHDKEAFNKDIRQRLKESWGIEFDDRFVWSMDDWKREVMKCGLHLDRSEMFELFGKQEILFLLARKHPKFNSQNVMLIDDRVEHLLRIESKKNDCKVTIVNVKELP